jgi:uncharacterized protein (DUF885 family)
MRRPAPIRADPAEGSTMLAGVVGAAAGRRRAAAVPAALAAALLCLPCCSAGESRPVWRDIRERYFIGFLERNPVTCTYLGGDGYSPALAGANSRLPDVTPEGRAEQAAFYRSILSRLESVDPASLTADDAVDRDLTRSQIRFLLHLEEDLRYWQRSLDTYVVAPFRGVDWQIQQMTDLGAGRYGTAEEWERVVHRVAAIPAFLRAAEANLREGIRQGNVPDHRMVRYDGVEAAAGNAAYFRATLPETAGRYLEGQDHRDRILTAVRDSGAAAAAAFSAFAAFLERDYGGSGTADRYASGEQEYNWRLRNNLILPASQDAAALFEHGRRAVEESQALLIEAARAVAGRRGLRLDWSGRAASLRSARRVMDALANDSPRSDEEMFRIYRSKAQELVEYARRHGMFDLPQDYRLDIVETPPVLQSTLEAAYYPAPAFKDSGIGRFYLTPSRGDVGILKENNIHAVADLCAHEGFPGHDWQYQFMRARARSIGAVRWLTPGAVEDSSSMWQDSMSAEGWALYAEQLMAEPQPGASGGFYTPEERIYQLKWQVLRDARVHLDTGLHTGRLSFDQAVAYFLANVDLLPDACEAPGRDPVRDAVCHTARRAIYRYSKWPTQAITYHLGKRDILELRQALRALQGDGFSLRGFHERLLSTGTIPLGYVRDRILQEARRP